MGITQCTSSVQDNLEEYTEEVGLLQLKTFNQSKALEIFDNCLALKESATITAMKGLTLFKMGEVELGLMYINAAVQMEPSSAKQRGMLGKCLYLCESNEEALACLNDNVEITTKDSDITIDHQYSCQYLAMIQYKKEMQGESVKYIDQQIKMCPDCDKGYQWKAMSFYQLGFYSEVVVLLKECLKINPQYPSACYVMGISQYNIDDINNAEKMFVKSIMQQKNHQQSYSQLAEIQRNTGRIDMAISILQKYKDIDPMNNQVIMDIQFLKNQDYQYEK